MKKYDGGVLNKEEIKWNGQKTFINCFNSK